MSEPTPPVPPAPVTEPAAEADPADELEPVYSALESLDSAATADHLAVYTRIADDLAGRLDAPASDDAEHGRPANG